MRYAILDADHNVIPDNSYAVWEAWHRALDIEDMTGLGRAVARDQVGAVDVSTVFLAHDHSHETGVALWFETMTFGGDFDSWLIDRYSTWDEAVAGHKACVERLAAGGSPFPPGDA